VKYSQVRLLLCVLLFSIAVTLPCWSFDRKTDIKARYQALRDRLSALEDSFGEIGDDELSPRLLQDQWQSIGEWISAYLDSHPIRSISQLDDAVHALDPSLAASAVRLEPQTYAVGVQEGERGTVFVIKHYRGGFSVAWNLSEAYKSSQEPLLAAWSAEGAQATCWSQKSEANWGACGPLYPRLHRLPSSSAGSSRFLVDAGYAGNGGTIGGQLSIWEWDGAAARSLFVGAYVFMIDQSVGTRVDGRVIRVRTKEDWRTFFSCGSCEGRQMEWTIRVGPDGVEDLGKKAVTPELDWVDELLYRMDLGQPTYDLALPEVTAIVKQLVFDTDSADQTEDAYLPAKDKARFSGGMISNWSVRRGQNHTTLCFSADEIDPIIFRIKPGSSGPFFMSARPAGHECSPPKARTPY